MLHSIVSASAKGYNATMRIFRQSSLIIGVALTICTVLAVPSGAATQTRDGAVDISSFVAGAPPTSPPTIDDPATNTTFTKKVIDVKGGCTAGLIVRVFRNDIFAGSALCQTTNSYSLPIDLAEERNDLVARQYDAANQSSPDSNVVIVFYAPPVQQPQLPGDSQPAAPRPSSSSGGSGSSGSGGGGQDAPQTAQFQLIIDYDYSFRGVRAHVPLHLPVHFSGGTPPYAVSVSWGDGTQSVISRENAEQFFADHTYDASGAYAVKLTVSDKNGNQASLQFILLVNGNDDVDKTAYFGLPVRLQLGVAIPALVLGFISGLLVAHYWKRRRDRKDEAAKGASVKEKSRPH